MEATKAKRAATEDLALIDGTIDISGINFCRSTSWPAKSEFGTAPSRVGQSIL
jgi:hypothetical protein